MLAFEPAPLPIPPNGLVDHDFRLVPELVAGVYSDDTRAEGFIGSGLRGEIQIASHLRAPLRTGIYASARALVIGKHQDVAAELAIGEYLSFGRGTKRFGWEGGAIVRPRPYASTEQSHELDAVATVYFGWQ
jgi:hypothetical protein